jgi:hypothetical protein
MSYLNSVKKVLTRARTERRLENLYRFSVYATYYIYIQYMLIHKRKCSVVDVLQNRDKAKPLAKQGAECSTELN